MARGQRTRPGKMRSRLLVQKVTRTVDSFGQGVPVWTDFARLWGHLAPMEGEELVNAQQVTAKVTHKVTIRRRDDIVAQMRIIAGNRTLNIETAPVSVDDRPEYMSFECAEEKA